MNLHQIKRPLPVWLIVLISISPPVVHAQMDDYEVFPRIRSYLQMPMIETDRYLGDVRIPRVTEEEARREAEEELPEEVIPQIPEYPEIIQDRKIDSESYIVGPGDLIKTYLWGELDREYQNRVTPEGYYIVPTVGAMMVADHSLAEAREMIIRAVKNKYEDIDVTVYLGDPRRFRINISGLVENPGLYDSHGLMRVSDVLEWAGLRERSRVFTVGSKKGSSKRSIKIYRGETNTTVDLVRFEKFGEIDANPYVSAGDHIHVPHYIGDIAIYGEVHSPEVYEFKPGDRVIDLVGFGDGLTAVADSTNVILARYEPDGRNITYIPVNLYDALINDPDNPKYLLQESDRLYVQTKFNYKDVSQIIIDGQVKFPGSYPIIPQETTLSDLVSMAGGFTEHANLEEARIIRASTSALRDLEFERLRTIPVVDMTDEEYEYFKSRSRTIVGQISIDFVKLFRNNDQTQDIFLETGDHIFIPLKREMINVLGAINEPGFIRREEGENVDFYISKAGGYSWNAKSSGTRIIKAKSGQRFRPGREVNIEGGDIIHVPEKKEVNYWEFFSDAAQVFANVATVIIIAQRITE